MTTAPPTTTTKPRRRWLQFSLRGLLVLMLAFGCGLGWLAREVQRARTQREAAKVVEEQGGWVEYKSTSSDRVRTAVAWVGNLLGEDLSMDVARFRLIDSGLTDAGLAHLGRLTQLQQLDLAGTQVTDAGLVHLVRLTQLQELGLDDTRVSDAGLVYLRGLTELKYLMLDNTRVSDSGLTRLHELTRLKLLFLTRTQVTDAGVAELQKALPNCRISR